MTAEDTLFKVMLFGVFPLLVILLLIYLTRRRNRIMIERLRTSRERLDSLRKAYYSGINSDHLLKMIANSDVDELRCYGCNDLFDPSEEKCDKCGASRPRCIICFQDLKPIEAKNVIKLPCCDVYVHENHMLTWLEQNQNCPNCRIDLSKWFDDKNNEL